MAEVTTQAVILVVEDSPETLGLLHETLDRCNYTVLLASDGEKALQIVSNMLPDAILMDAMLPGANGFETTRRIKQLPNANNIPVLFMTGLDDTEHIVEGFEAGGVDYLVKPINITEMVARLKVHLDNARDAQTTRSALEISGQSLLTTDAHGQIVWATPQIRNRFIPGQSKLSIETLTWLHEKVSSEKPSRDIAPCMEIDINDTPVQLIYLGQTSNQHYLLRILDERDDSTRSVIKENFELTDREADVLLWLVNGKSNKEIAEILEISPRTVNKHLDHVYVKLGVENRTAAAMATMRRIAEHLYA